MKKLLLVLSLFIIEQAFGMTKDELVKYDFYNHRVGLSNEEQYKQFIYPYLEEACDQLKVIQYCFNHAIKFSQWYIQILAEYSAAVFNQIALGLDARRIQALESELLDKIKIYKDITDSTLDIQEELDKTVELIKHANEEYYKKIGLIDRISFWGQRQLNRIFGDKIARRENKRAQDEEQKRIDAKELEKRMKINELKDSIDKQELVMRVKRTIKLSLKTDDQGRMRCESLRREIAFRAGSLVEQDLFEWGNGDSCSQEKTSAFCKRWGIQEVNVANTLQAYADQKIECKKRFDALIDRLFANKPSADKNQLQKDIAVVREMFKDITFRLYSEVDGHRIPCDERMTLMHSETSGLRYDYTEWYNSCCTQEKTTEFCKKWGLPEVKIAEVLDELDKAYHQ